MRTPSDLLGLAAERLGVADPRPDAAALLAGLPADRDDPAARRSSLLPGCVPFELSFSEEAPGALRWDLEPVAWGGDAAAVADRAAAAVAEVASRRWGPGLAAAFARRVAEVRAAGGTGPFGAFAGLVHDRTGLREAKVYLPSPAPGPGPTGALGAAARSALAGLDPLMWSVAVGDGGVRERAYLVCRPELDVLSLEAVLAGAGVGHRFPALALALLRLTGGRFVVPPASVVVGLRATRSSAEVKVDLLLPGLGVPDPHRSVAALLRERPPVDAAFGRWLAAVTPPGTRAEATVVSARVTPERGVRLAVYARPVDAPPVAPGTRRAEVAGSARA